ncbi:MAG: hypothetical protein MK179_04025 [Pirellulaceae bacterium]|nr:hypothetical protein [Pirellulaceae bacterium]
MYQRYTDVTDEDALYESSAKPRYRERARMPVARHKRARGASKETWRSSKVSNRYSRTRGGFHQRRKKQI